jgi:hypothetical protein
LAARPPFALSEAHRYRHTVNVQGWVINTCNVLCFLRQVPDGDKIHPDGALNSPSFPRGQVFVSTSTTPYLTPWLPGCRVLPGRVAGLPGCCRVFAGLPGCAGCRVCRVCCRVTAGCCRVLPGAAGCCQAETMWGHFRVGGWCVSLFFFVRK